MIDGTDKPKILSKFAKRAARYNEFRYNRPKWRFHYPSIYLNEGNPFPFRIAEAWNWYPYNLQVYIFFLCRYFSYVADLLEDDCTVHHAPWSGDGGSLDTSYLLKCLPMFLSSSVYEPVNYDAIIFNSGLHDINCCGFPREVKRNSKSFLTNYVNYNNYWWWRFDKRVPRVSISRWFRFTERELLVPP